LRTGFLPGSPFGFPRGLRREYGLIVHWKLLPSKLPAGTVRHSGGVPHQYLAESGSSADVIWLKPPGALHPSIVGSVGMVNEICARAGLAAIAAIAKTAAIRPRRSRVVPQFGFFI